MLNDAQRAFFARNGFLHVEGSIDPETCAALVDHTWTRLPQHWDRGNPATWWGDVSDSCQVASLRDKKGFMKFQRGDLLGHPVIERAFASSAAGGKIAEALIGHKLAKMRVRGLYCIMPVPEGEPDPLPNNPHIESHPVQLIALCYLEDVVPGGGGLHVWPGSHRDVYPAMGSKLEHVATPDYEAVYQKWAAQEPMEVPGKRGDVVIIHHRLLHAPSINRAKNIRYGFLCDYQREDFKALCEQAPGQDIWEDWPAIAALPAEVRDAPPDFVLRQGRPMQEGTPRHSVADRLSVAHGDGTDPSRIRKADASALARLRRVDDVWLLLSDNPDTANEWELFPRGSDLASAGVSVRIDGVPVKTVCRYDMISKVEIKPGPHAVEIEGLDRPAWLRVVKVKLPFGKSEFLLKAQVPPGERQVTFFSCPAE